MTNELNKKGLTGYFIKLDVLIFGVFIVIIFLFVYTIPGLAKVIEKTGLIDTNKAIEEKKQSADNAASSPEKEKADKAAKGAFDSIVQGIEDCKAKSKDNCICDLEVPMFSNISTGKKKLDNNQEIDAIPSYIIQFWSSTDRNSFTVNVFEGYGPGCKGNIQSKTLGDHKFDNMELCTSIDLLTGEKKDEKYYVPENMFELARTGISNMELYFYNVPACSMGFPLLGTIEQYDGENTKKTSFKLYKADNSHICLIIGRDGNEYGWFDNYRTGNIESYREKIGELSKTNHC